MKPKQLLIAAAVLLGVVLVSWIVSAAFGTDTPRAEVAKGQGTAPSSADTSMRDGFSSTREPAAGNTAGYERTLEELQQAKDRIAELERTVEELSNAWNQFAEHEEAKRKKASMRGWGPEQATGPPDSLRAGDQTTAWATLQADGGVEWLQTQYERAVEIAQVRVLENDAPGAVVKIVALTAGGSEVVLWQGDEPRLAAPADQVFPVPPGIVAQSIRVYLDTRKVPGWNEIDAVELIGRDGSRQWAKEASASSTYARTDTGITVFDRKAQVLLR